MAEATTPETLEQKEQDFAQKIVTFVVLIALYFFKDKAKTFLSAIAQGLADADTTQEVKMIDIVDAGTAVDTAAAEWEGNPIWIKLATAIQTVIDDIKAGKFGNILDYIHLFGAVIGAAKEAKQEKAATTAKAAGAQDTNR